MRFPLCLWACALAIAGCASINSTKRFDNSCLGADSKPFRSEESLALAGTYELTMVSQWEDERGRVVRGQLELWEPDTIFQRYEPSWYAKYDAKTGFRILPKDSITTWIKASAWKPLIGIVDIDLRAVSASTNKGKDLHSRDPFEPGVRLEGANLQLAPVRLGFLQSDGSSTGLTIERTGVNGFSGRWNYSGFGVMIRNGKELPDPSGVFCARRLANSASSKPTR